MLRWRLISAAVIVVVLAGLAYVDFFHSGAATGVWLLALGLLACVMSTRELLDMFAERNLLLPRRLLIASNVAIVLTASIPVWGKLIPNFPLPRTDAEVLALTMFALAAAMLLAFVVEMWRFEQPGEATARVGLAAFTLLYAGLAFVFVVLLRTFQSNEVGMAALLSMIVVVKMSDIGAYTFGRLFGRHKMAPKLSPGKTWEGAAGGLATACVASWLVFEYLTPSLTGQAAEVPLLSRLCFGLLIAAAGMLGDLAESLIKRDMHCKDSSRWLPGLGGVLDILDSLLAAAPWAYLCWATGLVR